jgi:hypothetical protein
MLPTRASRHRSCCRALQRRMQHARQDRGAVVLEALEAALVQPAESVARDLREQRNHRGGAELLLSRSAV